MEESLSNMWAATADEAFDDLCETYAKLLQYDVCDLVGEGLGDRGARAVGESLENAGCFELNLCMNDIGDVGATALADALEDNTTLTKVDLSNNLIGPKGAESLAIALQENVALKVLILEQNELRTLGVICVAQMLSRNSFIEELSLNWNSVKGAAIHIANNLKENNTLVILKLGYCDIDDRGAKAMRDALLVNETLQRLEMPWNKISNTGCMYLAEALKENTGLHRLNLFNNAMTETGGDALLDALNQNNTLAQLNILENGISEDLIDQIDRIVRVNAQRLDITFSDDEDSDDSDVESERVAADESGTRKKVTRGKRNNWNGDSIYPANLEAKTLKTKEDSDVVLASRDYAEAEDMRHVIREEGKSLSHSTVVESPYKLKEALARKALTGQVPRDTQVERKGRHHEDVPEGSKENLDHDEGSIFESNGEPEDESSSADTGEGRDGVEDRPPKLGLFNALSTLVVASQRAVLKAYNPGGVLGYTSASTKLDEINSMVTLESARSIDCEMAYSLFDETITMEDLPTQRYYQNLCLAVSQAKTLVWHTLHALTDQKHDAKAFAGYHDEDTDTVHVGQIVTHLVMIILLIRPSYQLICYEVYLKLLGNKGSQLTDDQQKIRVLRDKIEIEIQQLNAVLSYQNLLPFLIEVSGGKEMHNYYEDKAIELYQSTKSWPEKLLMKYPNHHRSEATIKDMQDSIEPDFSYTQEGGCINKTVLYGLVSAIPEYVRLVDFRPTCSGRQKTDTIREHLTTLFLYSAKENVRNGLSEEEETIRKGKRDEATNGLKKYFFFSGSIRAYTTRLTLQLRKPVPGLDKYALSEIAAADFLARIATEATF